MMATAQTGTLAHPPHGPAPVDRRCFIVTAGGATYGLPVEHIQTVFEMVSVTPVPLAPREVLGLVNLRGNIATAVSLRRRLGLDEDAGEGPTLAVGIEYRNESFALIVDEVGDVITLDDTTLIETPPHLGAQSSQIESVHRLYDSILPVLDLGYVLSFDGKD